jgi:hypothetical protein
VTSLMQIPYQFTWTALLGLVVATTVFMSQACPSLGPNLALSAAVTTSSRAPSSPDPRQVIDRVVWADAFETLQEDYPWVQLDLRRLQPVSRVVVFNRHSCCKGAAIPLEMALSTDGQSFTTVAQQYHVFAKWDQQFQAQPARYVRLRLMRPGVLQLNEIEVYQ